MLQEQRLATALVVSLAAHAAAGLGLPPAWRAAGPQGPVAVTTLAATLTSVALPARDRPAENQAEAVRQPAADELAPSSGREASPQALNAAQRQRPTPPPSGGSHPERAAHGSASQSSATSPRRAIAPSAPGDADPLEASPPAAAPLAAAGARAANELTGSDPTAPLTETYWRELAAWLDRHKRYPRVARDRRQQGVVRLSFVMDRQGRVLAQQVTRSSGYPALDREATRLLERAEPLPAVPESIDGHQLEVTLPIDFRLP